MGAAKAILVLLSLIGVTINPVVTRMLPCCCTEREAAKPPCCKSQKTDLAAEPAQACCQKHAVVPAADQSASSGSVFKSDCCCVKQLPASTPLKAINPQASQNADELAFWPPLADPFLVLDLPYLRNHFAKQVPLSGPPLLALHCTWQE